MQMRIAVVCAALGAMSAYANANKFIAAGREFNDNRIFRGHTLQEDEIS